MTESEGQRKKKEGFLSNKREKEREREMSEWEMWDIVLELMLRREYDFVGWGYLESISPTVWWKVQMCQYDSLMAQSFFCAVQFHQQNYAQLYNYAQIENMLNFYPVCPVLYAGSSM